MVTTKRQGIPRTAAGYYRLLVQSAGDGTFPSLSRASKNADRQCRYRANRRADCPRRCAAGLLIPDGEYGPDLEGRSAWHLAGGTVRIPAGLDKQDLEDVQNAHDQVATKGRWDRDEFVRRIDAMDCFAGVPKKEV